MEEYTIKLKCGCIYNVFAESKWHANCKVDYLHYIEIERDKTKICKKTKNKSIIELVLSIAELKAMIKAIKSDNTRDNMPEKTAIFIIENDLILKYRHVGSKEIKRLYIK